MLIQRNKHSAPGKSKFDQFFVSLAALLAKTRLQYLSLFMLLGAFGLGGIYYGVELHRTNKDWTTRRTLSHFAKSNFRTPVQYIKGQLSNPEILEISMKHMDYMELAYRRSEAWKKGKLTAEEKKGNVPAKIFHNGETLKAKIRLKGLFLDHLHDNKWSLRVSLKGKHALFGMKRFSLQAPHTRNFIHEWVYHQALRSLGLMALDFRFVSVRVNGNDLGIFSVEEHFDKRTAVNNLRPEGFFVKPWHNSLSIYREARMRSDHKLGEKILILNNDYQLFLDGKLKASELFDVEKTAKYFALQDLFGAGHGDILGNFVCYYNPTTLKLEPIGSDANAGSKADQDISPIRLTKQDSFFQRLFQDPAILSAYAKASRKLDQKWIEKFLISIDSELQENLNIIYKEHPEYYLDFNYLKSNQEAIVEVLNAKSRNDIILNPTYDFDNNGVINAHLNLFEKALPVEVFGVWEGKKQMARPKILFVLNHAQKVNKVSMIVEKHEIENNLDEKALHIKYRVLGETVIHEQPIYPALVGYQSFPLLKKELSNKTRSYPFITVDEVNKRIYVKPGNHKLLAPLVIPVGYKFEITGGTSFDLNNNAVIYSNSPVSFIGDADNPILITSSDGTGGGIVVMEAGGESVLRHVIVEKQVSAVIGSFKPSGAVFFYESPVLIDHSIIRDINTEDGVNIARSTFEIRDSIFRNCASDALDIDFGTGKVVDTLFFDTGNDGLDFSGSKIDLTSVTVKGAGDKGVSAGEKSEVHATGLTVIDTVIGLASKDRSTFFVKDTMVRKSKYCMAGYQKKPVFGPGKIVADKVAISECDMAYALEKGSTILHEGRKVESNIKNARKLFYEK